MDSDAFVGIHDDTLMPILTRWCRCSLEELSLDFVTEFVCGAFFYLFLSIYHNFLAFSFSLFLLNAVLGHSDVLRWRRMACWLTFLCITFLYIWNSWRLPGWLADSDGGHLMIFGWFHFLISEVYLKYIDIWLSCSADKFQTQFRHISLLCWLTFFVDSLFTFHISVYLK